jgi:hypothetical protein
MDKEEEDYFCEDCGCEISYYQYLMRSGSTPNEGYCEDCWDDFIESLFEEE